jgi:hypothetical protein
MKPTIEAVAALFNRKSFSDVLFKSAFFTVSQQLICLDDLERAGDGLSVRNVLGLVSFLKEERQCKVILLLNDEEHPEKDDFNRHLEKVADATLAFELTPEEAAEIALTAPDKATKLVKTYVVALGITNIRVIKKIERLARRLVDILDGINDDIVAKKVATLVLASWSVQQQGEAPLLGFLKDYNRYSFLGLGREDAETSKLKFYKQIKDYPFNGVEDFDLLVMDGAVKGYFDATKIRQKADELHRVHQRQSGDDSEFSRVWRLYHGSLSIDDNIFLDELCKASINEAIALSPMNINSAIRMLREYGRNAQADEVIANYVATREIDGPEFFDIDQYYFSQDTYPDDGLRDAFAVKWKAFIDSLDPFIVVKTIAERRTLTRAEIALLAKLSADDFERIFEALQGEELRPSIETILVIGNGHAEGAKVIRAASVEALNRIAAKSPMRAKKLAVYGILPDEPGNAVTGSEASALEQG